MRSTSVDAQALILARELAQLQGLRREYERLVPEALELAPDGSMRRGPEVRVATVMFTDLRGFTGLTESFAEDPIALLEVVNEHLEGVVSAVTGCGGVVEKYVGDGVLATFGARTDIADHHERAVAAALGVVRSNQTLNRRRSSVWGFRLDVGVGLAAGRVVVGRVGPVARAELGVLGDPVNVAARLVAQAGPGEVLLEAGVYRSPAAALIAADTLGELVVRGRSRQIEAYRISLFGPATNAGIARAAA